MGLEAAQPAVHRGPAEAEVAGGQADVGAVAPVPVEHLEPDHRHAGQVRAAGLATGAWAAMTIVADRVRALGGTATC